jgi:hypothetical protein
VLDRRRFCVLRVKPLFFLRHKYNSIFCLKRLLFLLSNFFEGLSHFRVYQLQTHFSTKLVTNEFKRGGKSKTCSKYYQIATTARSLLLCNRPKATHNWLLDFLKRKIGHPKRLRFLFLQNTLSKNNCQRTPLLVEEKCVLLLSFRNAVSYNFFGVKFFELRFHWLR